MRRVVVNDLAGVSALDATSCLLSVGVGHDIARSSLGSLPGESTESVSEVLADTFFQLCARGFRLAARMYVWVCKDFGKFSGEHMNRHLQELPSARSELFFSGDESSTREHLALALALDGAVCVKNTDELSVDFRASWKTVRMQPQTAEILRVASPGFATPDGTYVEDYCEQLEDRVRRHTAHSLTTWLLRIRRCVLSTDVKCFKERFDYV